MEFKRKFFGWIAILFIQAVGVAQTTEPVTLTIKQAEELFFKNNFMLLAQQYDIDRAGAAIIQSKVYPNPQITADMVAYQGQENLYFPSWNHGNFAAGLEQVILMGGKRRKQIEIAKMDKKIAEAELTDLTRNLQLQIWQSFYTLHHQQKLIEKYNNLLSRLQSLITSYEAQVAKNNIALKDLVRLKSVYVKINNDKSEESEVLIEEQSKLNILLGTNTVIQTVYTVNDAKAYSGKPLLYDLILNESLENRPDLNQAKLEIESAKLNVSLQRKQNIPDVTLRAGYNQQGDAFNNQYNVGIGIPLPIFDRNRGNIQSAKIRQEQQTKNVSYKELEIQNQTLAAYQNYTRSVEEYKNINALVNDDFDAVFNGINTNFQKGNVSMIEFTDFFEAYNEAQTEVERVKKQLAIAAAQINYVTGTNNF
ncbi:TolC family protein [Flavobacterium sp. DG1-102-2]|uniref:TolC family protein n=1 Tax=Flavobacterium sp. DG1-102-2 TaxID=3081663 RepID=UPI0029499106|nr:TolC family protein [Flavobacterium sp. DG1-102-2]MDV6167410.1 TolC family protein [Flavobacterium sp. DG1-102-2]